MGAMGTGATFSHTYAALSVYTAMLTATNSVSTVVVSTVVTIVPSDYKFYLPLIQRGTSTAFQPNSVLPPGSGPLGLLDTKWLAALMRREA